MVNCNIGYKKGYYRERSDGSCFWQVGSDYGEAKSIHAAKLAITRSMDERAEFYA